MVSPLRESDVLKFNWSVNSLPINKSSSRQKFRSTLGLSNIKSISGISDFKSQEVAEMSKIFHLKLLTEKILEFLNATKIITSYDHVIHIQGKQNSAFIGVTGK